VKGPQTLFASFDAALCFAQRVANINGAPMRVVYDRAIRWYFIDEEPDSEWLDSWSDAALVEPSGCWS
jgi:hypothetical protein